MYLNTVLSWQETGDSTLSVDSPLLKTSICDENLAVTRFLLFRGKCAVQIHRKRRPTQFLTDIAAYNTHVYCHCLAGVSKLRIVAAGMAVDVLQDKLTNTTVPRLASGLGLPSTDFAASFHIRQHYKLRWHTCAASSGSDCERKLDNEERLIYNAL